MLATSYMHMVVDDVKCIWVRFMLYYIISSALGLALFGWQ